MAYEAFLPDTSTRQKMLGIAESFAPSMQELLGYTDLYRQRGKQSLQDAFLAAQQNIGAQFTPAMRLAQNRLGGSPLLADSGYANRLNRQIQTAAFGDLSRSYGNAAAEQSQGELSMLQNLINQRLGAKQGYLSGIAGGATKKKKWSDYAGDIVGAGAGAFLGGYGSGLGERAAK